MKESEFYNHGFYLGDHFVLVNDHDICKKYKTPAKHLNLCNLI